MKEIDKKLIDCAFKLDVFGILDCLDKGANINLVNNSIDSYAYP